MRKMLTALIVLAIVGLGLFLTPQAKAQCEIKNFILLIGDGMAYNQITATNYWQGTTAQAYQNFPVRVAMSTFAYGGSYDPNLAWTNFDYARHNYTDSAPAASAMSTGFKVRDGQINVDPIDGHPLYMYQTRFEELGRATGVVTSVQWSHATPAGFGAHNISRNNYSQIAQEMLDVSGLDVIMGCGHPFYDDNNRPASSNYSYVGGQSQWDSLVAGLTPYTLIQTRAEFQALMTGPTPAMVCGTAQCRTTLQQSRTTVPGEGANGNTPPFSAPFNTGVPTLVEMTVAALNVLDNDPDGFFLMIEGGAIDWACHGNQKGRMIEEQLDFNNAVDAVIAWVEANSNWNETLVLVTGDHECGHLFGPGSGMPDIFNPVINNGPGVLPGMQFYSGSHTNQLVPIYAKGPGAVWFVTLATGIDPVRGVYCDNTNIAHVIFGYLDCTLDAQLLSFNAVHEDGRIHLTWATASESGLDRFEIVRDGNVVAHQQAVNSANGASYHWVDENVVAGAMLNYALYSVATDGTREELATASVSVPWSPVTVTDYALDQNYPNPFNATTQITFQIAERGVANLTLFNATGQEVQKLYSGPVSAGQHRISFNAGTLPSGLYTYRLEVNGFTSAKKMLLLK